MKVTHIKYDKKFKKSFKRLDKIVQLQVVKRVKIFRDDCFDPRLKTHKLSGKLDRYYAFSINHSYRIVFEFIDGKAGFVGFIKVGTHDEVY